MNAWAIYMNLLVKFVENYNFGLSYLFLFVVFKGKTNLSKVIFVIVSLCIFKKSLIFGLRNPDIEFLFKNLYFTV